MDGAVPPELSYAGRILEDCPGRTSGQPRQATYIGQTVDGGFADAIYKCHSESFGRELLAAASAASSASGERLLFGIVNLENFCKTCQLEHLTRCSAQAEESEAALHIARNLQSLNQ